MIYSWRCGIGLLVLVIALHGTSYGESQPIQFVFSKPGKTPVTMTASLMTGDINEKIGKGTLEGEELFYAGTGYRALPDNTKVNGYDIGRNVPTRRQNCGGLACLETLVAGYQANELDKAEHPLKSYPKEK